MSQNGAPPTIRFPGRPPGLKTPTLVLPRRNHATTPAPVVSIPRLTRAPFALSEASVEARKQIEQIVAFTRTSTSDVAKIDASQSIELERSLRQLEARLAERERYVEDLELRLADRERDIAETEALVRAREKLLHASRKTAPAASAPAAPQAGVSQEEHAALENLKAELERQAASLAEAKAAVREREAFLEDSENRLFAKVQAQQEKETEQEQREEELQMRARRLQEREEAVDPRLAVARKDRVPARVIDEFNE